MPTRGARARPRLITLSSDVGAAYAAQMKAVLARTIDPARVIELAHDLPAHGIREAAFVVRAMARGFPAGTVHVVVVDPGVGGRRAPIAIGCRDDSALVGPDNGVLYPLAQALGLGRAHRLEVAHWPSAPDRIGTTFDGRDVFAPAAARLAEGVPVSALGPPVEPTPLHLEEAERRPNGASGEIVHVDHFGNLITNVPTSWVPPRADRIAIAFGRGPLRRYAWVSSYEALGVGRAGLLGSSFGTIELSVAEGRATDRFRVAAGTRLRFEWPGFDSAGSG